MLKKGIALFMAICMMSTCVPMAFAEEPLAPALAESTSVAAESAAPQSVPASTPAAPAESAPQSAPASASAAPAESAPQSTPASTPATPAESAPQSAPASTSASSSTSAPQSESTPATSSSSTSAPQSESASASTAESTSTSESASSEADSGIKTPMDEHAKRMMKPYAVATYELVYFINEDGNTVTIEGISGTASGELVLPASIEDKPVTTIGYKAFYDCSGFTGNLTIPNSVTTIGEWAFYYCTGFKGGLTLSDSLTTIGEDAFSGCSGFTGNLTIPDSVTTIGGAAFYDCSGFTGSLTLPNSVTTIGEWAFYYCTGFTGSLTIPNSVTTIGNNAFGSCSGFTGSLTLPNSVTTIGNNAFGSCSGFTGNLTLPNSATTIGDYAFWNCSGFTGSLTLPNSLTTIGESAFSGCSGFTGNLALSNSVTTIGESAFSGCSGFTGNLTLPNSVTTIGNGAFSGCSGFTGSLTIPDGVTTIGNGAFSGCSGFTGSLTIPNSVTTIESVSYDKRGAFQGCSGFAGTLTLSSSLSAVRENTFSGCSNITDVIVPPSVTAIADKAFENCSSLKTVHGNAKSYAQTWAESMKLSFEASELSGITFTLNKAELTLGLYKSEKLVATVLPTTADQTIHWYSSDESAVTVAQDGTVTVIAPFYDYGQALMITAKAADGQSATCIVKYSKDIIDGTWLPYPEATYELTYVVKPDGTLCITGKTGKATGELVLPKSIKDKKVTTIGDYAFESINQSSFTGSLTIPDGVTTIGNGAFSGCTGFTGSLTIPNSVTTIDAAAFYGCKGFTGSLTIPDGVTTIGGSAFDGCSGFTGSLTIPNSVTSIEFFAFSGCSGFTGSLTLPNSVTTIGQSAFSGCSGFTGSLTISDSVTTIGRDAFFYCSGFTGSLTIPNSVTTIGAGAFSWCSGFTGNLAIPNSVTTIDAGAFWNCSGFTGELTIPDSVTSIGVGWFGHGVVYYHGTFKGCTGFTGTLTLPNKLKRVPEETFFGCSKITDVIVPPTITYISPARGYLEDAFGNCNSLKTVHGVAKSYAQAWAKIKGLDFKEKEYEVTGVTLNKTSLSLTEGDSETLTATVLPANATDKTVTWESSNAAVATVANGKVTAVKAGTATITAKTANGKSATCAVTVTAKKPDVVEVTNVTLNTETASLTVGDSIALVATIAPTNASDVSITWQSSDVAVASVTDGNVKALKIGTATITVMTKNGKKASCVITVKTAPVPAETGVEGFVERLYTEVLGRASEPAGKTAWVKQLKAKINTGAEAARGFVLSDEMAIRNLSNEKFLTVMYRTFFNRDPDSGGFAAWLEYLNNGVSREYVLCGFACSVEFQAVCDSFGIERGVITHSQPRDKNPNLTAFVNRLYTKLLDRQGEEAGLNNWCSAISNHISTPKKVAHGFVFSKELELKNLNDEKFVEYMYRAFMGREYDAAGKAAWVKYLQQGKTREDVFNGFADSVEFANIIKGFGL